MKPVNVRSIFAVAAQVCEHAINNEEVNLTHADKQLKALDTMLKCMEFAHKHSVCAATIEGYERKFNEFNPQLKNFDALPE